MRRTHYAINFSNACDKGGDGVCDGEVPAGEGNSNAVSDECTCPCHRTTGDMPLTVEGMREWHEAWHGVGEPVRDTRTAEQVEADDAGARLIALSWG